MKLYRLKEEVKKYFDKNIHAIKHTLEDWETINVTFEALEEVDSKIKVYIKRPSENEVVNTIYKYGSNWTEQEREFIEFCLNEFVDLEHLKLCLNNRVC